MAETQADRIADIAEAEIARLKARIAELESELAARPPLAPKPVTVDVVPPALRGARAGRARVLTAAEAAADKRSRRDRDMREAVKAAEQAVQHQWRPAFEKQGFSLWQAEAEARAIARKDLRAQWAHEDAEAATKVELPSHITRIDSVKADEGTSL